MSTMNTSAATTRRVPPGASALGAIFVLLWGSAWIAGKFALQSTGPLTLLVIRFAVAALVLLPVALLTRANWPRRAADYIHLAIAGVLVNAVTLAGVYIGLSLGVSVGTSALVAGTAPLFTALGAGPMLDERIENQQLLGMLIGLAGVGLVVFNKMSLASGGWEGYAFTVLSLAAFVAGTLYQKRFVSAIDLSSGNFVQFAVATLAVLPLAACFEGLHAQWNSDLVASALFSAAAGQGKPSLHALSPRARGGGHHGLRGVPRDARTGDHRRLRPGGRRCLSRVSQERVTRCG
jgi:drug/metabolite transporter (DMT)-like permease